MIFYWISTLDMNIIECLFLLIPFLFCFDAQKEVLGEFLAELNKN